MTRGLAGLKKSVIRSYHPEESNVRLGDSDTFSRGSFGDAARYRSTGKIRGEVRPLVAGQLAEIDGLVRGLLGVSVRIET